MNYQSSIGLTEELLTNLLNQSALECHLRITYEKYYSLLNVKNIEDEGERGYYGTKLETTRKLLEQATENRREVMRVIQSLGTDENNPDYWCTLKHAAIVMNTAFEAWQVDLNNDTVEQYYHKTVEQFNLIISEFLGYIPQACSACLADSMQSQEELEDILKNTSDEVKTSTEDVLKEAEKIFGKKVGN